jgi:hypothetical protein
MKLKTPATLSEEDHERAEALVAVAQRIMSGDPSRCLCCSEVVTAPVLIGYARGVLKGPGGVVFIVCLKCTTASEDIRADILDALGEEELKTSTWAS